tara:strand:- start:246 stop:1361 length:1116 start_codon:yes stop_codon:yes gene_type:complete
MKISLTISLFFHVIIFTFLNIYKNEKISDEFISNVSVISQKKYDALISKKPIITNNLIHQKPVLINSKEVLVSGLFKQKDEFIDFENKVLKKLPEAEFNLSQQNIELQANQIPKIQKKHFRYYKPLYSIQGTEKQTLSFMGLFIDGKKRINSEIPILNSSSNSFENIKDTVFSNNPFKLRNVQNLKLNQFITSDKFLSKSKTTLDDKIDVSLISNLTQETTKPDLINLSSELIHMNNHNINKDLIFKKYDISNQNLQQANLSSPSNKLHRNSSQVNQSLREWGNLILVAINSKIKYPKIALNNKMDGQVLVRIKISTKGNLKSIKILKSSGFSVLDNEVLRAIETNSFLPSAPKNLDRRNYTFKLPVRFEI